MMDAETAMNGCGPTYVYLIVEAWINAGIKFVSSEVARTLVVQTMLGAAASALTNEVHPAALNTAVTPPAGRTIVGAVLAAAGA